MVFNGNFPNIDVNTGTYTLITVQLYYDEECTEGEWPCLTVRPINTKNTCGRTLFYVGLHIDRRLTVHTRHIIGP